MDFYTLKNLRKEKKMDIKKYICPVCNVPFNENDDAVFCPDCGTPHHRECWKISGKCFNEQLHGTAENIENTFKKPEEKTIFSKPEDPLKVEIEDDEKKPHLPFSIEIKNPEISINPAQTFLIEGKPSFLYEVAVKKNQRYYIPSFMAISEKTKKSFSWNFWAFLVPFAWSVYRKMYKFSVILFALYMVILSVSGYYIFSDDGFVNATIECMEEDPEYLQNISLYLSNGSTTLTVKQQKLLEEMQGIYVPSAVSTISSVLLIACRLFMGLRANTEYMKTIRKTIEKGEKKGLRGDKLKMFVYKKRGLVPIVIPAIIAIFEWLTIY